MFKPATYASTLAALIALPGCLTAVEQGAEPAPEAPDVPAAEAVGTEDQTPQAPAQRPVAPPTLSERRSCASTPTWHTAYATEMISQSHFGVAEDGRLVVHGERWGAAAFRGEDGQRLFGVSPWVRGTVDSGWHVRADVTTTHTGPQVTLKTLLTEEPQWSVDLPERAHNVTVRMAPTGARVVVASCRDQITVLRALAIDDGTVEHEVELNDGCLSPNLMYEPAMAVSRDGLGVVLLLGQSLLSVNLLEGGVHRLPVEVELAGDGNRYGDPALALSPQGDRVALVGGDARVHVWSLPDLVEANWTLPAGLLPINQMSYMPSTASPLAFSGDGQRLAWVTPDADIGIADASSGATLAVLDAPEVEDVEAEGVTPFGNRGDEPLALQFLANDGGLVAGLTGGVALWRCDGSSPPAPVHPMRVILEAPETLRVGEPATFTATHLGTDHLHGHAFFVDGEPAGEASTQRRLEWTFESPGVYEVRVELMDGLDTGAASTSVVVLDARR